MIFPTAAIATLLVLSDYNSAYSKRQGDFKTPDAKGYKQRTGMLNKIKALFTNSQTRTSKKHQHLKNGAAAEIRARKHLESRGFDTIDTNVYSRFGEIDIIMIKDDELVFVEVRQRTSMSYGSAAQSVHIYKQRKLINAARYFLQQNPEFNKYYARFDVITIESNKNNLQWHPCAFSLDTRSEYQT